MSRDFDPYQVWLNIPPGHRPPSYYDLLGVPEDETDHRRIDEAATERIRQVRARALGEQSEYVTPLLNEISQALDCLVNPARREVYDQRRLRQSLDRWLELARQPADFYELLDARRFTPDRAHLLGAIRSARWYLEDRSANGVPDEQHVSELLLELDAAEDALASPSAFQQYHRSVMARLYDEYVEQNGADETRWDTSRLQAWLERDQRVHPHRLEAVAQGICDSSAEMWDRLLLELFPIGSVGPTRSGEPWLAELDEQRKASPEATSSPDWLRQTPPRLPGVPAAAARDFDAPPWHPSKDRRRSRNLVLAVLGLILLGGVTATVLNFVVGTSENGNLVSPDSTSELLDAVAQQQLRETRFAKARALLENTPPDYQEALALLQATCVEFPDLEGLEREYALSARCCVHLNQWSDVWPFYREARERVNRSRTGTSEFTEEVVAVLDQVRQSVFLSTSRETEEIWEEITALDKHLAGPPKHPEGAKQATVPSPEPRQWRGPLTRLVVYRGEIHMLVTLAQHGEEDQIEAVTDRADFADQLRDCRSAEESGVADWVWLEGRLLAEAGDPRNSEMIRPAFRLEPEATLVWLRRFQRVDEPSSVAEMDRQRRDLFGDIPKIGTLARYLQAPPEADDQAVIEFDGFVTSYDEVAEATVGSLIHTLYVGATPEAGRSAEVRLVPETSIGLAGFEKGDRLRVEAKVVRGGPDELVLEAVDVQPFVETPPAQLAADEATSPEPNGPQAEEAREAQGAASQDSSENSLAERFEASMKQLSAGVQPEQSPAELDFETAAHEGPIQRVVWSPQGDYLATAGDRAAKIWDPTTGETTRTCEAHAAEVTDVAWYPGDPTNENRTPALIATASRDGLVRVFNLTDQTAQPRSFVTGSPVSCLSWHPDGKRLAAGLDSGEFCLCNLIQGGVQRVGSSVRSISSIAWHPRVPELLVLADEEGLIWVWDLRGPVFPSCGRVDMNSTSIRFLMVSYPQLGMLIKRGRIPVVNYPARRCYQVAWSPDGNRVAAAENGIEIWDYRGAEGLRLSQSQILDPIPPRAAQKGPLPARVIFTTVCWSPDGRRLAAGTNRGAVLVFDVSTGRQVDQKEFPTEVGSVAWSPDGRHLAAGSTDGSLTVWAVEH